MKKRLSQLLFVSVLIITYSAASGQLAFTGSNGRLNNTAHSGCSIAVSDWNGDGLDDIIRLDSGIHVYVEIQRTNNIFESRDLGRFNESSGWAWAMCLADVDHNGYKDILAGGYSSNGIQLMMTANNGMSANIVTLAASGFFLQNATFADFNNDGWIDIFCCDDNDESHVYLNDGSGNLIPSSIINFDVTNTDDSGNYGSAWTDFDNDGDLDLYIAKCRQGVYDPADGRRINVLFVNDGSNNYVEMADSFNLDIGWQSWTASFGDIDNDADLDLMVTNHDHESQILQNDGTGHYTDITLATGFDITDITPIESVMEDFDNDGFVDILATGSDARFYKNNGNGTFTRINGLFNNQHMESFSIGDLNHDGFTDIYAGYASIYTTPTSVDDVLWLNKGNSNHFFTLDLHGTASNRNAIGARALLYGAWGVQIREVRAGESYGTVNSSMLHFGLGQATVIDSVVIRWPAGSFQTIVNPAADQFLTVTENDCVSPEALVTYAGSLLICAGQTVTLTAPAGFDYLWSDGSTGQSLTTGTGGEYNVRISQNGNNCYAVSKTLTVVVNPDETPVITAAGETEFCNGGSVQLTAPSGLTNYSWSNGYTTQNMVATQNGTYTLTIQGLCQAWTSAPIQVTVHTVPDPVCADTTISSGTAVTLISTGINVSWYDAASGGNLLQSGNSFTTPVLNSTTTYFMESSDIFGGGLFTGGMPYHTGSSQYSGSNNTNATTTFNVNENCTLKSVKVYTDTPGNRLLELRDSTGGLVQSALVYIVPDSQVINLNWYIPAGNDYTIGTDVTTNQAIPGWGNDGPRLKRNSGGVTYPYLISNLVELITSSQGNSLFYYFYDWNVEAVSYSCISNRIPVTVTIGGTSGIVGTEVNQLLVYPNPAHDRIIIRYGTQESADIRLHDNTGRLLLQEITTGETTQLDVSGLARGIYQVEIRNDRFICNSRLIIQ